MQSGAAAITNLRSSPDDPRRSREAAPPGISHNEQLRPLLTGPNRAAPTPASRGALSSFFRRPNGRPPALPQRRMKMTDSKAWWQSRTVWVNVVATLFAVLGTFKLLPDGLDQDSIVTAIMGAVAVANLVLRLLTHEAIA